jgi:hypothetical protein
VAARAESRDRASKDFFIAKKPRDLWLLASAVAEAVRSRFEEYPQGDAMHTEYKTDRYINWNFRRELFVECIAAGLSL